MILQSRFRIDTQHHFLPPRYVEAVGADAIARTLVSGRAPAWTPEVSLAAMDEHNIETAVVSISAPGFPTADVALCTYCNEFAADMAQKHAGRFGQFASLPLPNIDASLKEIAHALDVLGAQGICLMTSYGAAHLGDPLFAPIFDELDRRAAVVYIHPVAAEGAPLIGLPSASLEFPFDTTRAIANMLFTGTFARTPRIRYIFSHAGGTVPFLAERLARLERRPDLKQHAPEGVLAELRRLHYDIALSSGPLTLGATLRFTTPQKLLFASDFPHAPVEAMAGTVAHLQASDLTDAARHAIERGNALALMPDLLG